MFQVYVNAFEASPEALVQLGKRLKGIETVFNSFQETQLEIELRDDDEVLLLVAPNSKINFIL